MREFRSPDGMSWGIEIRAPTSTNAMVVFHYPDGRSSAGNRYAWYIPRGEGANTGAARLDKRKVLEALTDYDLGRLFRRSMPISSQVPRMEPG